MQDNDGSAVFRKQLGWPLTDIQWIGNNKHFHLGYGWWEKFNHQSELALCLWKLKHVLTQPGWIPYFLFVELLIYDSFILLSIRSVIVTITSALGALTYWTFAAERTPPISEQVGNFVVYIKVSSHWLCSVKGQSIVSLGADPVDKSFQLNNWSHHHLDLLYLSHWQSSCSSCPDHLPSYLNHL